MPKIIENLRKNILAEARRTLTEESYSALTLRRIAKTLNIGVGTIYNYFPSKEALAAGVMMEDWQQKIKEFEAEPAGRSPEETAAGLFALVRDYSLRYSHTWQDYEQHGGTHPLLTRYHEILVAQLAGYIRAALPEAQFKNEPYLPDFIAEIILRFASDGRTDYAAAEPGIKKLLKK